MIGLSIVRFGQMIQAIAQIISESNLVQIIKKNIWSKSKK